MKPLLFILIFPCYAYAVFQELYIGYQKSDTIKSLEMDYELNEEKFNFNDNKNDWKLEFGSNLKDSFLQSLYSFSSNKTISQGLSVGLTKQTYGYGSFSFSHNQISYDLSHWSTNGLNSFTADKVYESKNVFSYSYDFLKEPLRFDWEIYSLQKKAQEAALKVKEEKESLNFYQNYIETKLKIVLNRLYIEFEKRAQKRVTLLSDRIKDGLSRSIDLNQARLALISQQETILKNKTALKENIISLENILDQKIPENLYMNITWEFRDQKNYPALFSKISLQEVDHLKLLNDLNELSLEQISNQNGQSLNLSLGYAKNSVSDISSKAFEESSGSGKNDEKILGVTYSLPLGLDKNSAIKKQLLIQRKKNELDLSDFEKGLVAKEKSLRDNLETYAKTISLGQLKVEIAQETIDESQKLYLRGQISFEELLRAEEAYLNAKISLTNLLNVYDMTLAQLAYLNGQIKPFLASYTD